jgi:carboxyl-terminal processing protease
MIRLTTAHYYTPSGRCIQKPYTEGVDEYQKDYYNRIKKGELFSKDSVVQNKTEKFLTKATGRVVYGGGGIMPDVFVPLDTSKYYAYYNILSRKNVVNDIDIMDSNRDNFIQKYPDFKTFSDKFEVSDEMIEKILIAGDKAGVKRDEKSVEFARPLMKRQIKALIARDLFTGSHYFQIVNADDETIKKAVEVISQKGTYEKILSGK